MSNTLEWYIWIIIVVLAVVRNKINHDPRIRTKVPKLVRLATSTLLLSVYMVLGVFVFTDIIVVELIGGIILLHANGKPFTHTFSLYLQLWISMNIYYTLRPNIPTDVYDNDVVSLYLAHTVMGMPIVCFIGIQYFLEKMTEAQNQTLLYFLIGCLDAVLIFIIPVFVELKVRSHADFNPFMDLSPFILLLVRGFITYKQDDNYAELYLISSTVSSVYLCVIAVTLWCISPEGITFTLLIMTYYTLLNVGFYSEQEDEIEAPHATTLELATLAPVIDNSDLKVAVLVEEYKEERRRTMSNTF